jgi:uncharacterized membrane protein
MRENDNRHKSITGCIEENPLEILKKKYADGQIDRDEFLEKKRDLLS